MGDNGVLTALRFRQSFAPDGWGDDWASKVSSMGGAADSLDSEGKALPQNGACQWLSPVAMLSSATTPSCDDSSVEARLAGTVGSISSGLSGTGRSFGGAADHALRSC